MNADRRRVPEIDLEVFERHNDLVVAVDEDLVVSYANPMTSQALGYAVADMEGKHISEFVHPEDLDSAADAVAGLQGGDIGVDVTVATFRLKRADGSFLPVEFNGTSRIERGPYAGWLVFVGRHPADHNLHMRITEMLTSGAAIADVIGMVPEFGRWRHPKQAYAVIYTGEDGKAAAVGSKEAVQLAQGYSGEDSPWDRAVTVGGRIEARLEDLPQALASAAEGRGLEACVAIPVPDPLNEGSGAIVAWSTTGGPRLTVHRYPMEQMSRSLDLVMQWRQHIAALERAARYDALTGLTNRASFFERLQTTVLDDASDELLGVLYIDLDEFKGVNDRLGHGAGDVVLTEASRRMSSAIREGDVLARLGGDEFAVLCPGIRQPDEAVGVAARLLQVFADPVVVNGEEVKVGASIGVAVAPTSVLRSESLLERADEAMYQAKTSGRNQVAVFPMGETAEVAVAVADRTGGSSAVSNGTNESTRATQASATQAPAAQARWRLRLFRAGRRS